MTRVPGNRAKACQSIAEGRFARYFVAGHQRDRRSQPAMGDRNARVGSRGQCGGDAGNDLKGNIGRSQSLDLLGGSGENRGVTTLQSSYRAARSGVSKHLGKDLVLPPDSGLPVFADALGLGQRRVP